MKIKLVDNTIYNVARADVTNGRLEIDFTGTENTAEEIQDIFAEPSNLVNIELLNDDDEKFGDLPGWIVYGGIMVMNDTKTVLLTKEPDTTADRLAHAEANAISANCNAETAKELSQETAGQVTDLQIALTEIYEGFTTN